MTTDPISPDTGIRIAWWNTKLVPARVTATLGDDVLSAAADVLRRLMEVIRADIIATNLRSPSHRWTH